MNIFGVQISEKIMLPLITIIIVLLFNIFLNKVINSKIKLNSKLSKHEQRSRKTVIILIRNCIKTISIIVAILVILQDFGVNTSALVASVGAVSLVIGLAFQDLLKDFLVGTAIILESQYAIGEIVEINGFKGEVVGLSLKSTRLKSIKGEVCIISNRTINKVINYSLSDSLVSIDVGVSYDSDIKKVEDVLNELCKSLKEKIPQIKSDVVLDGIDALGDSSVIYRLSVRCSEKNVGIVKRKMLKEVKLILDKNKIDIPFPQLEVKYEK